MPRRTPRARPAGRQPHAAEPLAALPAIGGEAPGPLRAKVARADLLARFSQAANLSVPDVDRLLALVAEGVSDHVGDVCAISLVSDDGQWLDLAALHGRDAELTELAREVVASFPTPIDEGTDKTVLATGQTLFLPLTTSDEVRAMVKPEYQAILDRTEVHSMITAPLRVRGRVIGTLTAARTRPGSPYSVADRAFLEELAERAAVALDNARLYASRVAAEASLRASEGRLRQAVLTAERRALQQSAVVELGRRALSHVDLDDLMGAAVRAVRECLDTEYAAVMELLPGGNELLVRAGSGWPDGVVGAPRVPVGRESHAGYTLLVGEPVIVEDIAFEVRFTPPQLLIDHGVVSGAAVIVSLEGDAFGVLSTHSGRPRAFTVDEVNFLQSVANVVATAVVRGRHEELEEHARHQDRLAAIGQFAAGIAHDFNNLVTVIRLHADLLGSRPNLDAESLEELTHIRTQAEQAAAMVWQILEFAHRGPIGRVEVDLGTFCQDQLGALRRLCAEGVHIDVQADAGPHVVLGDAGRLLQVLMNLTTNARDAMDGAGRLEVRLLRVEVEAGRRAPLHGMGPGPWVRLDVTDTGAGIPADILARVFEPFFTTKAPGRGTGLGLAQVYGLVLQHDGRVDIRSVVGEGTTVTVWLPAVPLGPASPAGSHDRRSRS